MNTLKLTKEEDVFVVTMINGEQENRLTRDILDEHVEILNEIESSPSDCAVILTSDHPKFWSNGINLEWLLSQESDDIPEFKAYLDKVLIRWAMLKMPTIACITGHAFGGGAILSCAFDFRTMRSDRGYFCFPEVDINIPFTEVMHKIIDLLPDRHALTELVYTGRRVGGEEAKQMKIVSGAYTEEDLFPKTFELAQILSKKNRSTFTSLKYGMKSSLLGYL